MMQSLRCVAQLRIRKIREIFHFLICVFAHCLSLQSVAGASAAALAFECGQLALDLE
jgi:hypothetical protein